MRMLKFWPLYLMDLLPGGSERRWIRILTHSIHAVVGRRDQVGDIKLVYEDGEWDVRNHSIAI